MPEPSIREFADTAVDPPVRGFLHTPESPNDNGLLLTHSAGGNAQAPLLRALADTFAANGFMVLRCNLPFRQVRSFGPPGPGDAARDRAGLKNAIEAMKRILADGVKENVGAPRLADVARRGNSNGGLMRIFLGGHSYGGRQSSMLCAEESDLVAGLLLLSYPLHPPGKPAQLRTAHLPQLRCPVAFVQGTADPFGSPDELRAATRLPAGPVQLVLVDGAGHDLKRGRFDLSPILTALQRLAAAI